MNTRIAALGIAALFATACDRPDNRDAEAREESVTVAPPAPRVSTIELGKQATANLRVTDPTSSFLSRDTVYLAVVTNNATSDSRLSARWTYQDGAVIDSSGQNVARDAGTTSAVTQFRLVQEDGWPIGTYTVDIWLNDAPVGTRQFEVKRR
ncbi:MAG TPA: hypothetical protein VM764_09960 [Gemmatimonadaceae bacterium]|jgi:hypothetical protein|nr:hypothetical protein [Gemmatimonadaceae bacterium]